MTDQIISHYNKNAVKYLAQYDSVAASLVHADWSTILKKLPPGLALDIGAGSGRDALWLAQQGWTVTAVEPAEGLRRLGQQKTGIEVKWVDAQLPTLEYLPTPSQGYDLILLSAVWMHLNQEQRSVALPRLKEILSPDGVMIITLRFGPSEPGRPMYSVSVEELSQLGEQYALKVDEMSQTHTSDQLRRHEVSWKTLCLRQPGEHHT